MSNKFILLLVTPILLFSIFSCNNEDNEKYIQITGIAQGSTYHVICSLPEDVKAKHIENSINLTLQTIDNSISGYNKGSLLSKINDGEDLPLDSIFINVFIRSKEIWQESNGMFDPSASPLFDLWGFGFKEKDNVTQAKIDSILQFVGMDKVSLSTYADGSTHLIKEDSRMSLNFNAIAQGYTCDVISKVLDSIGSLNYLVEVGREIVCRGERSQGGKWRVGLDKPIDGNMDEGKYLQEVINFSDGGIVTSGNYRKFYIENGEKYSHTLNPVTGYPVKHNLLSATVLARDGSTADAYATWFMVVGIDQARQITKSKEDVDAYLIYGEQDDMKSWCSSGIILDNKI